jgi:phage portal protein BeeE
MTMSQLWPPVSPRTLERQVWNAETASGIPGMSRALQLYGGLIGSCMLQHRQGIDVLDETPRLLTQPDPDLAYSTFVRLHVEDWWLHGNACHLVTAREARTGYPAAVRWFPARRWSIQEDRDRAQPIYLLDGKEVPRGDVVHVQRGSDPWFPYRGMGVVEQHVRTLNRAGLEEAAEAASLTDRGTPSVAIITPQSEPKETELDAAADKWVERFTGTAPKPAFFPKDTQIVPLSWNPSEGQMVEARKMTLVDIANLMNLDAWWLGAEASSHNYKSPGPLFLMLMKTSLGPVMDPFEQVWSQSWLPRGRQVGFDRVTLLRDDLGSMIAAFKGADRFFPDPNEARRYMGFPTLPDAAWPSPAAPPEPTPPDDEDEQDEQDPTEEDEEA